MRVHTRLLRIRYSHGNNFKSQIQSELKPEIEFSKIAIKRVNVIWRQSMLICRQQSQNWCLRWIQWNKNILLRPTFTAETKCNIHRTQAVSCNKWRCLTPESTQRWMKWDLLANSVRRVFNGVAVIWPKRLLRITRSIFAPLARFYAVSSVVEGSADVVRQGAWHSPHRYPGRSVQFSDF